MHSSLLLVASSLATAYCLSLSSVGAVARPAVALRSRPVLAVVGSDEESEEERRMRLEALGREAAAEAQRLDSAGVGDDGLMAEFNQRLESEGGPALFKLKTGASQVGDGAAEAAGKVGDASGELLDGAKGWLSGLPEQQRKIVTIVGGIIAFQIIIGAITSAFR